MSRRGKRILKRGGLIVGLALATCGSVAYLRYPGMTTRMFEYMQTASFDESRNLFNTMRYWVGYMEKLQLDPATGIYGFARPAADGLEGCTMAYHVGDYQTAVDCFEGEIEKDGPSEVKSFWLAMSLLRQGESENCLDHLLARHHPGTVTVPAAHDASPGPSPNAVHSVHADHQKYCTLPILRHHERADLSRRAAAQFEHLLDTYDPDDQVYRWLLNFSLMTVDGFPDEVPERYRIETAFVDAFYGEGRARKEAEYAHLSFTDRAAELGVDTHDTGRGVVVEDFDRDGFLDIVTGGAFHTVRYYRNVGGTGFEERTVEAGLAGVTQPFVMSGADYDDDGWVDLFVARPFDHYRLFRNRQGRFVDVTEETGLLAAKADGQVAGSWVSAWGDVDLDGDLDLFLAQWGMRLPFVRGLLGKPRMSSVLFRNDGGRFVDVTEAWGLERLVHDEYYVGAAWGDYDADGDPDLFLSSPAGRATTLLENRGDRLVPVDLIDRREHGFFTAFLDIDHDGRLDIFQGGFSDARTSTAMTVFGEHLETWRSGHTTILRQTEAGRFEERNDFFSGDMPMATMGVSYGDLDLDGCHDFYVGTGNPESWFVLPNQMYIGMRDGRRCLGSMDNISMLEGFGTIQKGHSPVFFDFDEDGDQDVYSSLGGMWPSDAWPNQLFVNDSDLAGRAWVKLRLRGRETNHFGVGARITIVAETADGEEVVRRLHMDNKTGFGSAPYLAHIGLLDAQKIDGVEVYWPVSRCTVTYDATLFQLNVLDEAACHEARGDSRTAQGGTHA